MKTTTTVQRWPLLLFALLLAACTGTAARQHALLPAMRTAWQSIRVDVLREAAIEQHATGAAVVAAADEALAIGDPIKVAAVDWPTADMLAQADIDSRVAAGAIGSGVAASLHERLARFTDARLTYTRTP